MNHVFNIIERLAVIGEINGGVRLELNLIAWNGGRPKLDLRRWQGDAPLKGVTLTNEEAKGLLSALAGVLQ